ncbi:MAG: hypothetical protein LBT97_03320 [Planctomycetota bacterium]|jgi:hypothetical protein|nr:hypothetical protein [Planctomycetota bacterium]
MEDLINFQLNGMSEVHRAADYRVHGDVWNNVIDPVERAVKDAVGTEVWGSINFQLAGVVYSANAHAIGIHPRAVVWETRHAGELTRRRMV